MDERIKRYLEAAHNIVVDAETETYNNNAAEYGWRPIPRGWLSDLYMHVHTGNIDTESGWRAEAEASQDDGKWNFDDEVGEGDLVHIDKDCEAGNLSRRHNHCEPEYAVD